MDHHLLLRHPTTPIHPQWRTSPLIRSIHFVVQAGKRKRRRRIKGSALKKASNLAMSLTSSFRRLVYNTSLDLFLLYGGGGRPPISTGGSDGRRSKSKMIADLLLALALTSQVVRVGGRSAARDLGFRVLVRVSLGMWIVYRKRWLGFAIMGIMLYAFALWSRGGERRFGLR